MDNQLQSLQTLNDLSEKLGSSSSNQEITQDVRSVAERVEAALPTVRDKSNRLSLMLQCFQHQQCTQKHVTFLKEVKSRLEVEFCLDGVVDVENELEGVKVRDLSSSGYIWPPTHTLFGLVTGEGGGVECVTSPKNVCVGS